MKNRQPLVINLDDQIFEFYRLKQAIWKRLADTHGLPFNDTFFMASHDANPDKMEKLAREYPKLAPYFDQVESEYKALILEGIGHHQPNPVKLGLVKDLAEDYALVFSSNLSRGLLDRLETGNPLDLEHHGIFTTKEVLNGKPEPDLYLKIARKFDHNPNRMITVDSSLNGLQAAYLANAKGVYIQEYSEPTDAIREFATVTLEDLGQLKATLDGWLKDQSA